MPLNKYFSGHGEKVMSAMKEKYGEKKGERVFYATSNKRKKGEIDTGPSKKVRSKYD
jgi:hypothetical protein